MKKVIIVLLALVLILGLLYYARGIDRVPWAPVQETEVIVTAAPAITPEIEEVPEGVPVRSTQYGPIKGIVRDGVEIFYGIPYGADPAGELRWKAAQAPESWVQIRDCTAPGPISLQPSSISFNGAVARDTSGSTDCLNLDIYTTAEAEQLPVLVYIHSGGNLGGSSYGELTGNDLVARDGCVFVSVNYRTGLLGFNALPALVDNRTSGNFGLTDIAFALQWVRDNIAEFGGDARNITVSGFASGGRNVMAMLISSTFRDLFDRAIVYSGGMTICNQEDGAWKDAELIAPLAVEDGRAGTEEEAARWLMRDTDEVREYLYSLNVNRLTAVLPEDDLRMSTFPQLFGDNVTLPSSGFSSRNLVNDVPILMLTSATEFSLYSANDSYFSTIANEYVRTAARTFAIDHGSDFYRVFNTQLSAEKMADNYRSPIYLCQVNYGGKNSSTVFPTVGSFQGIVLPMLTSTHNYGSIADFTAAGYSAMAEIFHVYLRNFLRTGNPNGEGTAVEWTNWSPDTQLTLVLDASERTGWPSAIMSNVYKTSTQLINEINYDYTITYDVRNAIISTILNGRWFSENLDDNFGNPSLW